MGKRVETVERCWTLVGQQRGPFWYARRTRPTSGQPRSVEFDAQWVLNREESSGDIQGFYHTHPGGSPDPSARDLQTMRGWVGSFGKPLLCLIESDGDVTAYLFEDDDAQGRRIVACQSFRRGIIVAFDKDVV